MTEYCGGCGSALPANEVMCLQCHAPAAGYDQRHFAPLTNNVLQVPEVCCCCLNPRERVKEEKAKVYLNQNQNLVMRLPIPWCGACVGRRRLYKFVCGVFIVLGLVALFGLTEYLHKAGHPGWLYWSAGLGTAAVFFLTAYFTNRLPAFKRRGHTSGCDAFLGAFLDKPEGGGYVLGFRNKAFAARWRDLNPV